MKRCIVMLICAFVFTQCNKPVGNPDKPSTGCLNTDQISNRFLPADKITAILDKYVNKGLPGITFIARKGSQYWQEQKGLASREQNKPMKPCMVWPAFSITKMYTATAILRLKEEGKLSLDQKISTCLPASVLAKIPDADKITVRMLLNHSSGI